MAERIEVDKLFSVSKAVDTDWFPAEIGRTGKLGNDWDPVYHIIEVSLPTSAAVLIYRSGSATVTQTLNNGTPLVSSAATRMVVMLLKGDTYNLQYTGIGGPQLVTCRIIESLTQE